MERQAELVLERLQQLATETHSINMDTFGFTCTCGYHSGFGGDAIAHLKASS